MPMAQSCRAPVQQIQELATHRHPKRQNHGILPRLCRSRLNPTVDTLCLRNLACAFPHIRYRKKKNHGNALHVI